MSPRNTNEEGGKRKEEKRKKFGAYNFFFLTLRVVLSLVSIRAVPRDWTRNNCNNAFPNPAADATNSGLLNQHGQQKQRQEQKRKLSILPNLAPFTFLSLVTVGIGQGGTRVMAARIALGSASSEMLPFPLRPPPAGLGQGEKLPVGRFLPAHSRLGRGMKGGVGHWNSTAMCRKVGGEERLCLVLFLLIEEEGLRGGR